MVLEVLVKESVPISEVYVRISSAYPYSTEERYNLKVKVRLNVIDEDGTYIFHEDPIQLSINLNAQTKDLVL